jgi:hypothetical protein
MPVFGTGWAAGDIVVPYRAKLGIDVVEDPEFRLTRVSPDHWFSLWH